MSMTPVETLGSWIDRQYAHAARQMLRSISPVGLVKSRPGFDQVIRAVPGAVVASPVPASYDPDPDYFFHWYRDSAIVIEALRLLHAAGAAPEAPRLFGEFVRFSAALSRLDGRELAAASGQWRPRVAADFAQYLRPDAELERVHGDAIAAETRVNADGTLDISNWARPQHDGPALRALTVLRWMRGAVLDAGLQATCEGLVREDLRFTHAHGRESCYDIWEEERGLHYFTLRVCAQALEEGGGWLEARSERAQARDCRAASRAIRDTLDGYWLPEKGYYRSRVLDSGEPSAKELDIAVVLAVLQACDDGAAAHSVSDPRILATLGALDAAFERDYPINHGRPAARGPALGRYRGDRYYSGGAYYFSTLAAAELCFRAARGGARDALLARAERYLETVRAFTPESGDMSEQFDQRHGEQTSAKQLAWSYAAFISCAAARRAAMSPPDGSGSRPRPAS
ncbi:MAG: glucan 1,4-alpha-glucosidase [Proteobacteria bacterium]|nr:glucan 1,4-alpha-glucosidase [Pseudomonadota bacterium]